MIDIRGFCPKHNHVHLFVTFHLIFFHTSSFFIVEQVTRGAFVQFRISIVTFAKPEFGAVGIVAENAFSRAIKGELRGNNHSVLKYEKKSIMHSV